MLKIVKSAIGTKFIRNWSDLACDIAMTAVQTVVVERGDRKEIDIKRYVKIEKVHVCGGVRVMGILCIVKQKVSICVCLSVLSKQWE